MLDQFGRTIDYLRISVTDRCNLRCVYCMPESGVPALSHGDILTFEEILRIARCAADLGIRKIRVTGGEPLVRRGVTDLIAGLAAIPGIESLTLTTNGLLLEKQLSALVQAGITGINLSLDTLDSARFRAITRRDGLPAVLSALQAAVATGLPVKINCVPIAVNRDELPAIAGLARDLPVAVRFIEMMPIGLGRENRGLTQDEVLAILNLLDLQPDPTPRGAGPAVYYTLPGYQGPIGFISAVSHAFCENCNRVRLTADGVLKSCLNYQGSLNVKSLLRSGCTDAALTQALAGAIHAKPRRHDFDQIPSILTETRKMSGIGG